jgi:hypothetical protein
MRYATPLYSVEKLQKIAQFGTFFSLEKIRRKFFLTYILNSVNNLDEIRITVLKDTMIAIKAITLVYSITSQKHYLSEEFLILLSLCNE